MKRGREGERDRERNTHRQREREGGARISRYIVRQMYNKRSVATHHSTYKPGLDIS